VYMGYGIWDMGYGDWGLGIGVWEWIFWCSLSCLLSSLFCLLRGKLGLGTVGNEEGLGGDEMVGCARKGGCGMGWDEVVGSGFMRGLGE